MHLPIMMDTSASARDLWPRILSEAEEAASREHVLAPLIADCVVSRASLADAVCRRIASFRAPPAAAAPLLTALHPFATEDAAILSAGADIAVVLERDPRRPRRSTSFFMRRAFSRFRATVLQTPFGGSTVASSRFLSKGAHHAPCRSTFIPPRVWASGYSSTTRRAS
jgi:hypothetical protein